MISITIDLTTPSQQELAIKQFALDLYLPPFAKNKLRRDTEKPLKIEEIRKQLKKIRTDISASAEDPIQLELLLAIIVSSIVEIELKVSVSAREGAMQWQTFIITADLKQIAPLADKKLQHLMQAADNLGHFHSKPFNTLSAIQFCRDENYSATGEFGFTENQLDNKTASLSISGGSNQFSAFYMILISRINRLTLAEHLIDDSAIALKIQQFFSYFMSQDALTSLQAALRRSLTRTAADIGDALHCMDKQITLPIVNANNECEYLNITPIINPTVFAATSRTLFYVKGQSVRFITVELGGANPSNAGTAVGEVAGQNSRLQLSFPQLNRDYVKQTITSLNRQQRCFWSKQLKKQLSDRLLQYAHNPKISQQKKRQILGETVKIAMETLQQQIHEIRLHLDSLTEAEQRNSLEQPYLAFFIPNSHITKNQASNNPTLWLNALIRSFETLANTEIDYQPVIQEIKRQFKQKTHTEGGF
jgi:hypothetical protein